PAPLYFRAPLAPESCAHSSQLYTVAPAAARRRAAHSCSPSRPGHKLAPWTRRTPLPLAAAAVARFWPPLIVPIEQAHRSEKRRRVASEAIESTGMQLGRN